MYLINTFLSKDIYGKRYIFKEVMHEWYCWRLKLQKIYNMSYKGLEQIKSNLA